MQKKRISRGGFALPTVLIASVVMLTILAVSVSSVAAIRTNLKIQYYQQLAKAAGEAGVAYAKACLAKNGNVPLWSDAKPLTPATDCAGNVLLGPAVQVLVVAGGGGGGAGIGGGGGGGGVVTQDAVPVSTGGYTVTVGAGGAGGVSKSTGSNGGDSKFGTISAVGGGGGGGRITTNSYTPANDGGSGGGGDGTYEATTGAGAPGGQGVPGQGNDGGMGSSGNSGAYAGNGGGGGGAGGNGGDATGTAINTGVSGDGGVGQMSDISGQQVYYGAGGAGGRWGAGTAGIPGVTGGGAGGAAGDTTPGTAGRANTGAGGGGGASGDGLGGAGGSGIVVVRYGATSLTATGGSTYTYGPYKIHRFTGSSTFNVTSIGTATCPSDPRCSVTVNDTLRSSFSIGSPTVDDSGRAISIPNNGYVELLRQSNGQVWRTYKQPSVQVAVVPDLCSGAATSPLGWANAVLATGQYKSSLPNATTAQTITLADDNLNAGRMYFRKDFTVTRAGTYTVAAQTATASDVVEIYVDGVLETVAQNGVSNGSVNLTVGCHTVTARLTNKTLLPTHSQFTAAIQQPSTEPIVATDDSWRVSAGSSVHFSDPDFYADPSIWTTSQDLYNAQSTVPTWGSATGDNQTHLITQSCNATCPPSSSTYFRDSHDFVLTANTDVLVSALCDDDCSVYVDGNLVIASSPWSAINQQTLTLTAGTHHVAARLYNAGSATNPSKLAIAVLDKSANQVLTRTDTSWLTSSNIWIPGTNAGNDPMSYEDSFRPSPMEIVDPATYDVLVVAGGGGGGGNCVTCGGAGGGGGGGVVYSRNVVAALGTGNVIIGAGGAGGAAAGNTATNFGKTGTDSSFWTITAKAGGGGGAQSGAAGLSGASGGGGSGGGSPVAGGGGAANAGSQGYSGGAGAGANPFNGGGGGGAGGTGMAGSTTTGGGDGGPGFMTYISGTRMVVGGGGGGGTYGAQPIGVGDVDSAGSGSSTGTGGAAIVNRGGGGGGANGSTGGGAGGAGSSGIVVIRFKQNSLTYVLGGSGTRSVSTTTVRDITYTVITFMAGTSTFQITGLTPY